MSKPLNSQRVPLRTDKKPKPFLPTADDLTTESIYHARLSHRLISRSYMWCSWFGGVGFLFVKLGYNYCDKCHAVLWSEEDKSPPKIKKLWHRSGNPG